MSKSKLQAKNKPGFFKKPGLWLKSEQQQ